MRDVTGGVDGYADRLRRAHALLDSLSAFAELGLEALDSRDLEGLDTALAARQEIVPTLTDLFESLNQEVGSARFDEDRDALRTHARLVQLVETRLRVALGAEQQRVGHELELLDGEEAVRAAYGQKGSTREGRNINIVR